MTVVELKKQYKTLVAAKAEYGLKAKSWVDLAKKITNTVSQPLTLDQLKQAIYNRFDTVNTVDLKKSKRFNMAIDGLGKINLALKATWEKLYRKFIGILPNETSEKGADCINGINIFDYFKPWQVFNLDPKVATKTDIKKAYRDLSKIYHPDVKLTGNAVVFERLHIMYKSILAGV